MFITTAVPVVLWQSGWGQPLYYGPGPLCERNPEHLHRVYVNPLGPEEVRSKWGHTPSVGLGQV